jgi:hypothetical protein
MSLTKRQIGRRVVGVGAGVALLVLGLQAPAFAAPAITALSPTSGPNNCVVVVTGTGFTAFPEAQTTVNFERTGDVKGPATFAVISDTTIWAVAGSGGSLSNGQSYNVRVSNPGTPGGVLSTGTFLKTADAGGCAPTITSFTPTCGLGGTTVVITGTNLIRQSLTGANVFFSPYDTATPSAVLASHTVPDVDDVTSLSVIVPSTTSTATSSGTTDGPIKVITGVGSAFSATSFLVPPPDCVAATGHTRAITLKLKKNGQASGVVSSTETTPFTDCVKAVPVKIQRKPKGKGWKNAGSATTDDTGAYSHKTKGKPGKYRALAPATQVGTPAVDCLKAKSATRTIK